MRDIPFEMLQVVICMCIVVLVAGPFIIRDICKMAEVGEMQEEVEKEKGKAIEMHIVTANADSFRKSMRSILAAVKKMPTVPLTWLGNPPKVWQAEELAENNRREGLAAFMQRNPDAHPKFIAVAARQQEAEAEKVVEAHMLRPPITKRSPRWR